LAALLVLASLIGGAVGGAVLPGLVRPGGTADPGAVRTPAPGPGIGSGPGPGPNAGPGPGLSTRVLEREESAIIRVIEKVRPSVVNISTVALQQGAFGQVFPQEGAGSGVIVSDDGYILTNNHVIRGATKIQVTLISGKTLEGRVIGTDPPSDLAVVKVTSPEKLPAAELGDSDALKVGQTAIAIGNPFGLGSTATTGIISALNRSIDRSGLVVENLIQTDAPINPGNSGGALVNSAGQVIGINTAIIQSAQSIGFAIPSSVARTIMSQLIQSGRVQRPFFGVGYVDVTPEIATAYGLGADHGILVREVVPGSGAAAAGIRQLDIIVELDGRKLETGQEFLTNIAKRKIGDSVAVTVVRGSERVRAAVKLGPRPAQ
jgi:S1-C subfamily serine protease